MTTAILEYGVAKSPRGRSFFHLLGRLMSYFRINIGISGASILSALPSAISIAEKLGLILTETEGLLLCLVVALQSGNFRQLLLKNCLPVVFVSHVIIC